MCAEGYFPFWETELIIEVAGLDLDEDCEETPCRPNNLDINSPIILYKIHEVNKVSPLRIIGSDHPHPNIWKRNQSGLIEIGITTLVIEMNESYQHLEKLVLSLLLTKTAGVVICHHLWI
jgi:hypothetical protein